jgi:hypothetical protein
MNKVAIEFDPNDPDDCYNWPLNRAPAFIGVDPAFVKDHTAIGVVTVHMMNGVPILAQRDVQVLEQGTPSETVVDHIIRTTQFYQGKVIIDSTNNLALVGSIANRFGREAANRLVAVTIAAASEDSTTPVPFDVAVGGLRCVIPRFTVSRSRTFERIVGEISNKTIRLSKHGDANILREQISSIEMIEGGGKRAFDHPSDGHDDAIWAVGLAIYAARKFVGSSTLKPRRSSGGAPRFTSAAWT